MAVWIEGVRGVLGLLLILTNSDWFGINDYVPWGSTSIAIYFLTTIFGGIYFTFLEKDSINPKVVL